jgi:hypothetical protein
MNLGIWNAHADDNKLGGLPLILSTTEDTGDAEENSVLSSFEPPILRVPRGGEVILQRALKAL